MCLLLSPFFVKIDLHLFYRRQMSAYTNGQRTLVESKGTKVGFGGSQRISFIVENSSLEGNIRIGSNPKIKMEDYPKKGEKFYVYFDSKNKIAMPDSVYLKQLCSLTNKNF